LLQNRHSLAASPAISCEESPHDPLLFHPTANPAKIALFLKEAGLPYETVPVDSSKGEQHKPAFWATRPPPETIPL
jgi:glutathione S-transferase